MSALTATAPMPMGYRPPQSLRTSLLDFEAPQQDRAPLVKRIALLFSSAAGLIDPHAAQASGRAISLLPIATAPSRTADATHDRLRALATAFNEALTDAGCMVEDGELEPPDEDTWEAAHRALRDFLASPLAETLGVPMISPMRFGRLSAEWHERGMNIELRFRSPRDVYAVIDDARGAIAGFRGSDPHLARAAEAIAELTVRPD